MKLTDLLSTAATGGTATLTDNHGDTLDVNGLAAASLVA